MGSTIHQAMTRLIFVQIRRQQLGKIKRWQYVYELQTNLYCGYKKNKHPATFYLTCDHFRDTTQPTLALNVGFHWQMTHVEFANDVVHLHHIDK